MNHAKVNQETGEEIVQSIGVIVALVSFAMLFATLLMGMYIMRFTSSTWPPLGMTRPSLFYPLLSTMIIGASSINYFLFEKYQDRGFLMGTIVLGVGFMLSQLLFWGELHKMGVYASTGIFPSIIYSFTWIHAAHVVLAWVLLLWLYIKVSSENSKNRLRIKNVGKFWHFLGIVWLIIFFTIFVF